MPEHVLQRRARAERRGQLGRRAEGTQPAPVHEGDPFAVLVGLVQAVPGQRDLDGSTQQTNPAQSVRARQRDPQAGPRGLAVALAPTQ